MELKACARTDEWWGRAARVSTLLAILAPMLCGGCGQTLPKGTLLAKRICAVSPARPAGLRYVASAQGRRAYEAEVDGISISVCVDDDEVIVNQDTKDPSFQTPEGVKIGLSLGQVLALAKARLAREPGWSYYVPLPSGWNAGIIKDDGRFEDPLPPESSVRWLFVRGRVSRSRTRPLPPVSQTQAEGRDAPCDGDYNTQPCTLECDDGKTIILAYRNLSHDKQYDADSHGYTFAQGECWIDNSEVDLLLKGDAYKRRGAGEKARQGDVVVYRDTNGDVQHSATVEKVDEKTRQVWVKDKPGIRKPRNNVPVDLAWPKPAKIEYYYKDLPPKSKPGSDDRSKGGQ